MTDFIPCMCGMDASLEFDGGWRFSCYECGLTGNRCFTPQAARKDFRILMAQLEADE